MIFLLIIDLLEAKTFLLGQEFAIFLTVEGHRILHNFRNAIQTKINRMRESALKDAKSNNLINEDLPLKIINEAKEAAAVAGADRTWTFGQWSIRRQDRHLATRERRPKTRPPSDGRISSQCQY